MGATVLLAGKVVYVEGGELFHQPDSLEEEGHEVAAFHLIKTIYLVDQEEGVGVELHLGVIIFYGILERGKKGLVFGVIVGLKPQIFVVGSQLFSLRIGDIEAVSCLAGIPSGAAVYIDADGHPPSPFVPTSAW